MICLRMGLLATCLSASLGFASSHVHAQATAEKLRSTKSLVLGYRESSVPFSYIGQDARPIGFSMDLCHAVLDHARTALDIPDLNAKYVPVNPSNRIPLLQNGTIDIECGSTSITFERLQQVAFSITTFVSQARWMVTADSGIRTTADLKGRVAVLTQGAGNYPAAQKSDRDLGLALRFIFARDHAESVLTLRTGRASAFMEEDVLLAGLRATAPNPDELIILPERFATYRDALTLRKGDPEFKALVDDSIRIKMRSGEFDRIYNKWFVEKIEPSGKRLALPMSEALKELVRDPSSEPAPVE